MNKIASWLRPGTKIIAQRVMKVSVEPSSLVISEGGWNPYISTLKLTFIRYTSLQRSSLQRRSILSRKLSWQSSILNTVGQSKEKDFFSRNYAFCTIWPIWPSFIIQEPAPGVMTFIFLLEHSLLFIIMYSLCLLDVLE